MCIDLGQVSTKIRIKRFYLAIERQESHAKFITKASSAKTKC